MQSPTPMRVAFRPKKRLYSTSRRRDKASLDMRPDMWQTVKAIQRSIRPFALPSRLVPLPTGIEIRVHLHFLFSLQLINKRYICSVSQIQGCARVN